MNPHNNIGKFCMFNNTAGIIFDVYFNCDNSIHYYIVDHKDGQKFVGYPSDLRGLIILDPLKHYCNQYLLDAIESSSVDRDYKDRLIIACIEKFITTIKGIYIFLELRLQNNI